MGAAREETRRPAPTRAHARRRRRRRRSRVSPRITSRPSRARDQAAQPQRVLFPLGVGGERRLAAAAQRARERTLGRRRERRRTIGERPSAASEIAAIGAAFDRERTLAGRRQAVVRIEQRADPRAEPEPLQSGRRQDDRVVPAVVELAQPRVDVAAQRLDRRAAETARAAAPRDAGSTCRRWHRPGIAASDACALDTNASRGSSRAEIAASTKPSGTSIGTSFSECTARSARPSRSAVSSSLMNRPLPPIVASGRSSTRSPCVVMPSSSTLVPRNCARQLGAHVLGLPKRQRGFARGDRQPTRREGCRHCVRDTATRGGETRFKETRDGGRGGHISRSPRGQAPGARPAIAVSQRRASYNREDSDRIRADSVANHAGQPTMTRDDESRSTVDMPRPCRFGMSGSEPCSHAAGFRHDAARLQKHAARRSRSFRAGRPGAVVGRAVQSRAARAARAIARGRATGRQTSAALADVRAPQCRQRRRAARGVRGDQRRRQSRNG